MTPETVLSVGKQALEVTVLLAAPILGSALIVGLVVGMVQAATQINEMTLSFVPKLAVVAAVLLVGGPWLLGVITNFTERLIHSIPFLIG